MPHHIYSIDVAYCYRCLDILWSVSVCYVCFSLLITPVSTAKMDGPIKMPFEVWTNGETRNNVLNMRWITHRKGHWAILIDEAWSFHDAPLLRS